MHAISFILRRFKPIPKPFWTGLLFSCMNTGTLWLHKEILDTQCRVLLLRAVGYCCFFPLHWVAAGFLHWIAAACNVWAAVFLFCTDFTLGTGFSFIVVSSRRIYCFVSPDWPPGSILLCIQTISIIYLSLPQKKEKKKDNGSAT